MFSSIFGTNQPSEAQLNEWNVINKVTATMPPTFMWTTLEDQLIDVEDSLDFAKMLSRHKIVYEYHVFEKGNHGLSLGDKSVGYSKETIQEHFNTTKWVDLALNWLERHHNTD
jgi:acetyl esterase/lipase